MPSIPNFIYGLMTGFGLYATASTAGLQSISDWGPNPSKIAQLQVYIPDKLAAKPAILLGVSFR
jgi:acetylxylan esterase